MESTGKDDYPNMRKPYTEKEIELLYDFFVNRKTFSELEKVVGRKGSSIVNKLHELRRLVPEKWEEVYRFYLKGFNETHGEEVRRQDREEHARRKRENAEMVQRMIVHGEEVKKINITIY